MLIALFRPPHNATMTCGHCGRRFGDVSALESHQRAKNHCYCRECDQFFGHPNIVEQHRSALHSFKCPDCNRNFIREEALQDHQRSTEHCYCRDCAKILHMQMVLNNTVQSFTPSNARTAIGISLVPRHFRTTRSPLDIATAANVIDSSLIQTVPNNTT